MSEHMKTMRYLTLILLTFAAGVRGYADGFRNPPEGLQALGKMGGNIVYIDDASTIARNPANLTDVEVNNAVGAVTFRYDRREFTSAAGDRFQSRRNWVALPNFFVAFPNEQQDWVAGFALTTPYGWSSSFRRDGLLRDTAPYAFELNSVNINPAIAYRVNNRFSVAAGLNLLYSEVELKQGFAWSEVTGNPATPDGETRFTGDGLGVGFNAAVTWNISSRQRAALTYRSAVKVRYEGDLVITNVPSPPQLSRPLSDVTAKSDFETDIKFPDVIAFGYGIEVSERLRVEANVEWIRHSVFRRLELDGGDNEFLVPDRIIEAAWRDSWTYGIAADFRLTEEWTLRAGYQYLESPIPSRTMRPTLSEQDHSFVSLGLGYRKGTHAFDAAYAYGFVSGTRVTDNVDPALDGRYDFDAHLIGLSYAFNF